MPTEFENPKFGTVFFEFLLIKYKLWFQYIQIVFSS